MTVAATTNRKTYTGDNVTTSFATSPVIFYATSDLQVRVTVIATGVSTLLTLNTHYTVSGGSSAGAVGAVSLAGGSSPHGALLSTEKLVILRVLPLTQGVDLVNNNNSDAEVLEAALDKLTDVDQQLSERQDRALTFPEGDVSGSTTTLPDAASRAGRVLGFDALGVLAALVAQAGTSLVDLAAAAGSSLIGFIQAGTGAVLRTLQSKNRDIVNALDRGVVQDDTADNSTALQRFFDSGPNYAFDLNPGVARFVTGLTWTKNQFGLYGRSPALRGNVTDAGPTLHYTGAGTALLLGVSPGVNATFLADPQIENIRLKAANNTAIGLRVWMANGGRFKNLSVYGSSGAGVGIQVEGSIDTTFDTIDIQGFDGAGGVPANYLNTGIKVISGFGGSVVTTTRFRDCYLHYCLQGAYAVADSFTEWTDCIFEANTIGFLADTNCIVTLRGCWFEANLTTDIYFGTNAVMVLENSPQINSGARQTYFDGNLPKLVVIRNNRFASSHVAPRFFNPAGSSFLGTRFVLDNNVLPAGFTFGALNSTWRNVEVVGMRLVTYRFRQTAVAANTSYNMPQDNADVNAYQMPDKGHILGSYTYYVTQNITAGTYTTGVKKNGGAVATFTSGANAATPSQVDGQYYQDKFVKGDTLQATVSTSAGFLATGGAFITEVIVAFGEDGM